MADLDYSHRDVLDKLGLRPGQVLAHDEAVGAMEPQVLARALERVGGRAAGAGDALDVVLVAADASTDVVGVLRGWRARLKPAGAIWVLTPKKGLAGYVDQARLIPQGLAAGLVDNKVCSVSDRTSAIRFVIRLTERPPIR